MNTEERIARALMLVEEARAELVALAAALRSERAVRKGRCPGCTGDVLCLVCAARAVGVAPRTLQARKAGTETLPRFSDRPTTYLRADINRFVRTRAQARQDESARRISLVRRRPRPKKN
ncbi:MAG TPA: hypothetical protein VF546_13975 [Pyrinomonadaceae bacterium]|jgi:hypothetical protein